MQGRGPTSTMIIWDESLSSQHLTKILAFTHKKTHRQVATHNTNKCTKHIHCPLLKITAELKYVVRAAKDYEEEAISNPDNIFLLLNWSEKEEITVYDGKQ